MFVICACIASELWPFLHSKLCLCHLPTHLSISFPGISAMSPVLSIKAVQRTAASLSAYCVRSVWIWSQIFEIMKATSHFAIQKSEVQSLSWSFMIWATTATDQLTMNRLHSIALPLLTSSIILMWNGVSFAFLDCIKIKLFSWCSVSCYTDFQNCSVAEDSWMSRNLLLSIFRPIVSTYFAFFKFTLCVPCLHFCQPFLDQFIFYIFFIQL